MIKLVVIEKGAFKVTNTITFRTNFKQGKASGGSFLDSLEKDLDIKKTKSLDLKANLIIDDIMLFKEDYYQDLKDKIGVVTKIPPSHQLLFEPKGLALGFEYVIDGVDSRVDPYELLKSAPEDSNLLFKHQGDYTFLDHSFKKIKPFKELYLFSKESYKLADNQFDKLYIKKFWPFEMDSTYLYKHFVNESKALEGILSTKPTVSFYVNETVSYINRYSNERIDIGSLMNVDLKRINARYIYIYKDKHIFKYLTSYKIRPEFDPLACNIYLIVLNIKLVISVYPNGTIKLTSKHYNFRRDIVLQIYEQRLPCIFKELGLKLGPLVFTNGTIAVKYNNNITTSIFAQLKEANLSMGSVIKDLAVFNNKYTMKLYKNVKAFYDMSVVNEHTRLLITIEGVYDDDLEYLAKLCSYYLAKISDDKTFNIDIDKINKNKRLQERDPVAYPKTVKWSTSCQKPNQPIIFNQTEYEHLPKAIKDKAVKYFNFTTHEEDYYFCHHPVFKYLGFKNFNNMGLPCCQKRSPDKMSKDKRTEYERILKTHIYIKTEEKITSRYEIQYSKIVGIDRVMSLPNLFKKWLQKNEIKGDWEYKIFGVTQAHGIAGCYMHALGISDPNHVDTDSVNLLHIKDLSKGDTPIFILANNKYDLAKPFLMVVSQNDERLDDNQEKIPLTYYYPIYGINRKRYNTKGIIDMRLFPKDDFMVKNFLELKKDSVMDQIRETWDIVKIHTFNSIIFYVLVQKGARYALIPVNNPIFEVDKLQTTKPPDLTLNMPLPFLLDVLKSLGVQLNVNRVLVNHKGDQVGFMSDELIYHHSPTPYKKEDHPGKARLIINYDLNHIYSTIHKDVDPKPINPIVDNTFENEISQFKTMLFKSVNTKKRNEIKAIFEEYDGAERLFQLHKIMSQEDYQLIKNTQSIEEALSLYYTFDNRKINELLGYSEKELDQYLKGYHKLTRVYLKAVICNPLAFKIMLNEKILLNIKAIKKYTGERLMVY